MVEYMKEFLEKPHWLFPGLPVCPFARKARLENRILYKVHRFSLDADFLPDSPVVRMISEFRQEKCYEVLLVVHPNRTGEDKLSDATIYRSPQSKNIYSWFNSVWWSSR
ncbi:MAG TPA: hypothetical protein V6D43_14980 [Candidatus Sericytochromatia bacterium]